MSIETTEEFPDTPVASPDPWHSLIEHARQGDSIARGSLLDRYRGYLVRVAGTSIPRDLQSILPPSDVVQETCIVADRHLGSFAGRSSEEFSRWLRAILLNHVRRKIRDFRRRGKRQFFFPAIEESSTSLDCSADHLLIVGEQKDAILMALAALPDHYRIVVERRNLQGQSFEEIGIACDRTPEAARKLWVRALDMLRKKLKAFDDVSG